MCIRDSDNTMLEKRCIIKWIAKHGWNTSISYVYPALATYLRKYIFDCGSLSSVLTDYFEKYKIQKVENRMEGSFLHLVDQYGNDLRYTKLQTRDNAIKSIDGKETAFLYWVDALGVEYLSYFAELARRKGLSMHVEDVYKRQQPFCLDPRCVRYGKVSVCSGDQKNP